MAIFLINELNLKLLFNFIREPTGDLLESRSKFFFIAVHLASCRWCIRYNVYTCRMLLITVFYI